MQNDILKTLFFRFRARSKGIFIYRKFYYQILSVLSLLLHHIVLSIKSELSAPENMQLVSKLFELSRHFAKKS